MYSTAAMAVSISQAAVFLLVKKRDILYSANKATVSIFIFQHVYAKKAKANKSNDRLFHQNSKNT